MPRDMSMNSGNGQKRTSKLNLDALGDAVNDTVVVSADSKEKPILLEEVEATIISIDFFRQNQLSSYQSDPSKKYFKCTLAVETEFDFEENGQAKHGVSRDNYSGLRFIPKFNEMGEVVLDATGEPVLDRLWLGDTSDFGALFVKAQEFDSSVRSYSDFLNFMGTQKKCVIKTEERTYSGNQVFKKEVIQRFI